jgi:hypothetical protein
MFGGHCKGFGLHFQRIILPLTVPGRVLATQDTNQRHKFKIYYSGCKILTRRYFFTSEAAPCDSSTCSVQFWLADM